MKEAGARVTSLRAAKKEVVQKRARKKTKFLTNFKKRLEVLAHLEQSSNKSSQNKSKLKCHRRANSRNLILYKIAWSNRES